MTEGEEVVEDYVAMRFTLRTHPMAFLRPQLTPEPGKTPVLAPSDRAVRRQSLPLQRGHPRNVRTFDRS
jgi:hypothetical protein